MWHAKYKPLYIFSGLLVFLFAFIIRLVFILNFTVPWVGDQPSLFSFSVNVMNGQYYGTNGAYWPPAFIFFAGFLFKIFGKPEVPDIGIVGVAQVILGAFTTLLVYLTAYKMFKRIYVGIIAGLLYAFLPTAVLYTGFFYTETLWVFFVFLSIWLTYVSLEKKRRIYYVITGISFGLSVLSRPTSLPLAFLTLILYLANAITKPEINIDMNSDTSTETSVGTETSIGIGTKIKTDSKPGLKINLKINWKLVFVPTAIVVVSMFLTILPWTIRNWYVMGEPVLIDVNPGINLYLAHNEKSNGFWVNMGLDDPVIKLGGTPEADREGKKRAWEYIKANPGKTIKQAVKVHKLFWTMENEDIQRMGPEWLKGLQKFYSFKILSLLGIVGIIAALILYHQSLWLITYMIAYNGLIDFLYWASRYRFAIEPFLVLFAGLTLAIIFECIYKCMKKLITKIALSVDF